MNLMSFEYFIALNKKRSFTHAAQQLHITQQTLSTHIASLEHELGCQLIIRRVPLELTYAGKVFLRYAEKIQADLQNMHREFCDITENHKGVLKIGVAFTRSRAIIPNLIYKFQKKYPNIEIQLLEDSNQALSYHLKNGNIDIAIANFPNIDKEIETLDFYNEEIALIIPKHLIVQMGHTEADILEIKNYIDLSKLCKYPFLVSSPNDIAGYIGERLLSQAGFLPIIKAKSDNIETLLTLCLQGMGVCFCPINLAYISLAPNTIDKVLIIHLGEQAKYPIQFGVTKTNYQWNIISEFIRISREHKI